MQKRRNGKQQVRLGTESKNKDYIVLEGKAAQTHALKRKDGSLMLFCLYISTLKVPHTNMGTTLKYLTSDESDE